MPKSKPDNERRTHHAMVMLTPREKNALKKMAQNEDRTVSYIIRQLIIQALEKGKAAPRGKAV